MVAVREPELISVLIPVRGRPAETEKLVRSLLDTARGDPRLEILLAFDDDDAEGREFALKHPATGEGSLGTKNFLWPRPVTLGDKLNRLALEAKGDILWFIANDYTMETPGWTELFRMVCAELPNGIGGVPFPHDDLHPDHAAFPILTRAMLKAVGYYMPMWFPYWFVDTWWDELGIMTGTKREIPVVVKHQGERGKSNGLVDLTFWATVFEETRLLRTGDALNIARAAWGEGSDNFAAVKASLGARANVCAQRVAHLRHPGFVERWEGNSASPPSPRYAEARAAAEEVLKKIRSVRPHRVRVAICVPSGDIWKARMGTDLAALMSFSSMHGIAFVLLNLEGSMISQQRNAIVETALRENADYLMWIDADMRFPPDALVRLLSHEKDIVGATYNKKTEPFETLGRLAGAKPERIDANALHEALLLPGGLMLVKAEVYRKMKFPMYYEAYHWAGEDGFASFCEMMRSYFHEEPSAEALEALRDTDFGRWIKDHFVIGEAQRALYWSEDLGWCRKARRLGFKLYCDLKLTNDARHVGSLDVTCLVPELGAQTKEAAE